MAFDPVDPRQSFPDLERGMLKYWREEDIFKRSVHRREGGEVFSFYDGPPFATGLPHYGHILAGTIKDVIPRYQTMRGKYVKRRFGWDCHGLPVEHEIEKEHTLLTKKDIDGLGVAKFNALCRAAVQRYTKEWRETVERLGRWVDMDHDYRTMDPDYMESIWWVFKQLHTQGLIEEGHKSMHVCPRCQTPLSNFEVTQGYKDIQDYSVTAMFELEEPKERKEPKEKKEKKEQKTYMLAWTTTAWTLPGNLLLAVHPETLYNIVKSDGKKFIVAKDLVEKIFAKQAHNIEGEQLGTTFVGLKYKPLFPYYAEQFKDKAFRVVSGDFVTTTDGTGIVHVATGYGEDDFMVGQREKTGIVQHVGIDGIFKKEVTDFAGRAAKPKDDHQSGDKMIAAWLKKHGALFRAETFSHSYPHCWRCDSPLLNYATSSWFVSVEKIKAAMLGANAKTAWVPTHLRDGRFGKWLEGARDWAISRSRYWGTPLPIWKNTLTGEVKVIGSRDELVSNVPDRFTKIIVTRHAESQGNVDKVYQGKVPGTALTETGRAQATALASAVAGGNKDSLPLKTIYCSPLQRTKETAEAIVRATGATLIVDERLKEVEFGEYEGKHIDFDDLTFIRERRAHKLGSNQVESIYHFQGMETWAHIDLRISAFFDSLLEKHRGETIVVVTHADLMMSITHTFTGLDEHKIANQPYPGLADTRTFYWDHERGAQLDLHRETVDEILWNEGKKGNKGNEVELTLMRHGETDLNRQRLVQGGEVDMPLNATGRKQAKAAALALKDETFDVILSSGMKRASQTAAIIAKELGIGLTGALDIFQERKMGVWSARAIDDVMVEFGPKKKIKGLTPGWLQVTPEKGESHADFVRRIRRGHDLLLQKFAGKRVLLVAHGNVVRAMKFLTGMSYVEAMAEEPKNARAFHLTLSPQMRRIEEVLDCWFESGSMPYAQEHFPFEGTSANPDIPVGFPADFIAEGLDQTRGWFYTLMVLSAALFQCPAFRHCIVNGIVLAEDGKKMSKRLKNYPEPTAVVDRHGADAVRFALMNSPAVRGEDLRFSENLVEETVRSVLLPLWNAYRLFVTYANAAGYKPSLDFSLKNAQSKHILDRWIVLKTQALVNNMTAELDGYDLSATCAHLASSIDDLTNWYVRLRRRRLAGKDTQAGMPPPESTITALFGDGSDDEQRDALDTLYRVLLANAQLLAPFCPFVSEAIYLNLVAEEHGSIHFTDWPQTTHITAGDQTLLTQMDNTRTVVALGLKLRADAKVRVRTPLQSVTVALPVRPGHPGGPPSENDQIIKALIKEELNVKQVIVVTDAASIAQRTVQVDARKVGPRLGGKVQELIRAGKEGIFEEKDGAIIILGETLSSDEATVVYRTNEGKEPLKNDSHHQISQWEGTSQKSPHARKQAKISRGVSTYVERNFGEAACPSVARKRRRDEAGGIFQRFRKNVAAGHGIVVSLDTTLTDALTLEGQARELIHAIQMLRKEAGLEFTDAITLSLIGADAIIAAHQELILSETKATLHATEGKANTIVIDDLRIDVSFEKVKKE